MLKFYLKVGIYFVSFIISLFALSAIDFNRFLKKDKVNAALILYMILSLVLGYLLGSFFISIIYYFQY